MKHDIKEIPSLYLSQKRHVAYFPAFANISYLPRKETDTRGKSLSFYRANHLYQITPGRSQLGLRMQGKTCVINPFNKLK